MATLADLIALRDALEDARFSGTSVVRNGDKEIRYKSDSEMADALASLNRRIAAASGSPRISMIRIQSSKGLDQ